MRHHPFKLAWLALFAFCCCLGKIHANDGLFYTSGNQLIPFDEDQIKVSKEVLSIHLNANGTATVDVYYEFLNPEKEERSATVGFVADAPQFFTKEQLSGTEHPYIKNFTVEMNDLLLKCRYAVVANDSAFVRNPEIKPRDLSSDEEEESGSGNYLALRGTYLGTNICYVYYFQANFKPGVNRVHHRYTYALGANVCVHYQLSYKLSPALRWANHQIDNFTLRITNDGTPLHFFLNAGSVEGADEPVIASLPEKQGVGKYRVRDIRSSEYDEVKQKVFEFSLRNAGVEFHARNFKPKAELQLNAADCSESGIVYKTDPCKKYLCAAASDEKLSKLDELAAKHYQEAMNGKTFTNKKLQKYFESRWWYIRK